MLFVTESFLIFFLITYAVFWVLPRAWRMNFLLVASIFFYASWSLLFTIHFLAVIAVNFAVMELWKRHRRKWLFASLQIGNVLNIGVFKYYYFLGDLLGSVLRIPAIRHPALQQTDIFSGSEIFLPLAISFYTFQIMAYGFDIYRGTYEREHNLRDVTLFKSFFPQLIAGPIMRAHELLPQIADYAGSGPLRPDLAKLRKGLWLILIGLVKKMLIADRLLVIIAPVFGAPLEAQPGITAIDGYAPHAIWATMFCSFMFLYCDFSAYSDLARGFGCLLGFEIPINFRAPLFSHSVSEFWRRWHLTFSLWIRDYVYIPLGGSRVSPGRAAFNLIFTFLLAGLWHGASYSFAIWGAGMGAMLVLEAIGAKLGFDEWPANWPLRLVRLAITWSVLMISCAVFFAPTPEKLGGGATAFDSVVWTGQVIARMFDVTAYFGSGGLQGLANWNVVWASFFGFLLFNWFEQAPQHFARLRRHERILLPAAGLVVTFLILEFAGGQKDFFYFQF